MQEKSGTRTEVVDARRSTDYVWSFPRGCGMREQLEELKVGGGGSTLTCTGGLTKGTGVAQLGLWVAPLGKD